MAQAATMTAAALRAQALAWLDAGLPVAEVCVVDAQGSVPREIGTRMLVTAEAVAGTIGGGHLELVAIERARALLPDAPAHDGSEADGVVTRYPLGPALGQCCGGVVTLRSRRLRREHLAPWAPQRPRFFLQLYGAGHVGRAIVELLAGIECRVQWIDERESEFPALALPDHIECVCVEPVEAEVHEAPPGAHYLVLTHSHDLDLRITEAILKRGDFAYLGLIGSATKRARFLHRFEERGIAPALLDRLTCPIGVPGIAGKEPEVLAIAVVAQLLQQV
jgi:xanthine dehydrogenase accessory factor